MEARQSHYAGEAQPLAACIIACYLYVQHNRVQSFAASAAEPRPRHLSSKGQINLQRVLKRCINHTCSVCCHGSIANINCIVTTLHKMPSSKMAQHQVHKPQAEIHGHTGVLKALSTKSALITVFNH
jgi:hypothetical protein